MSENKGKPTVKFLKKPTYPGGNNAFREYIKKNLRYPKEAMAKNIEGTVYLKIRVSDNGVVTEAHIEKGIGYGCNEEALRLARSLRYKKVKNRGVRLSSDIKIRIRFELPSKGIQYAYHIKKTEKKETDTEQKLKKSYGYTIKIKKP